MALRNYRPNEAGFKAMAVGPEIRKALAEVCEKGKVYAESISPFDPAPASEEDPHYKDSFTVDAEVTIDWRGQYPGPRAAGRLHNTSGHAAAVEYGYSGSSDEKGKSPHRVLGRTLEYLESEARG